MKTTWNRPAYSYTRDTTLGQLVTQFLEANDNDKEGFACYLVCYTPQIDRWLTNEFTVGLMSKLRAKFESATGIELDRLFILDAKHRILRDVAHIPDLKETDPVYASLLERFHGSGKQMRFDDLETYDEILGGIKPMCDACGVPLIAIQLEVSSGQLNKWIRDDTSLSMSKRKDKPKHDDSRTVERCILAHYVDVHAYDGDTTRLMVIADALFGPNFLRGHAISSFQELLDALIDEDQRSYPDTILGRELNLTENAIRKLRNYSPSGKTTFETTISYLRVFLIKHGYEHVVAEFDARAEELRQNFNEGKIRISPLELGTAQTQLRVSKPTPYAEKEIGDTARQTDIPPPTETPSRVSQAQPLSIDHQVRAFAASMIAQRGVIDGALAALAMQFPDVLSPPSSVQTEPSRPTSSSTSVPIAATLASSKDTRWSEDQMSQARGEIKHLLALIKRICQLEADQRDTMLKSLDPTLTAIHLAIKAASDAEPQAFLAMIRGDEEAMRLLRG